MGEGDNDLIMAAHDEGDTVIHDTADDTRQTVSDLRSEARSTVTTDIGEAARPTALRRDIGPGAGRTTCSHVNGN